MRAAIMTLPIQGVFRRVTVAVVLSEADVVRLLDPDALLQAVRLALIALSQDRVVQPLRLVMPLADPQAQAMPSAAEAPGLLFVKPAQVGAALATKLLTLVPANAQRGLPTLFATVVLMDPVTGQTLAVMEGAGLTAARTAAASAVAADCFCRPGPQVLALLGSGVLARSHAHYLRRVRPLAEIRVWSPQPAHAQACAQEIGGRAYDSAETAVRGADIVCTVTHARTPVLQGAWLKPGAFVAAVGAPRPDQRELDDAVMAHWVLADQRQAAEHESGDVIASGARVRAEIGEVLAGRVAKPPAGSTVIFKSLGQAVEDAVAAQLVWQAWQARP